jgi:hypothetical protein
VALGRSCGRRGRRLESGTHLAPPSLRHRLIMLRRSDLEPAPAVPYTDWRLLRPWRSPRAGPDMIQKATRRRQLPVCRRISAAGSPDLRQWATRNSGSARAPQIRRPGAGPGRTACQTGDGPGSCAPSNGPEPRS